MSPYLVAAPAFGVAGEYITGVDVSSERSDQLTLIPMLEKMESHLGRGYKDVTADAGYESEEMDEILLVAMGHQ